jgi:hypothetical protein
MTIPLVENGNSCVRGSKNSPGCAPQNEANQSWIILKITEPTVDKLNLIYYVSNNQNVSISIYGTYSSIPTNLCEQLESFPNFCKSNKNYSSIEIPNIFNNSYVFICIVNESNSPGFISLWAENANLDFFHFTPIKNPDCEKPTLKLIDDDVLIRKEEVYLWRARAKITGTPPFYYTFPHGNYEFTANSNDETIPNYFYSTNSFELKLGTVRNACGYGTMDPRTVKYLVYDKDTSQITCLPFDNNFIDEQNGSKFLYTSGQFGDDHENNPNKAIGFNGTDEYLKFPGRDLKGENFVMSLWVKPSSNTNDSQTILSLGGDMLRQNQLRFRKFGENQYRYEFELYTRNGERYLAIIPAEIDKWVHLTLVKTATLILIKDNNGRSNDYTFSGFDVPLLGNNSMLWFACDAQKNNKFRGRINNFKYFTGGLPNAYLQNLPNQNDCFFKLCEEIPVVTLPGFINLVPGSNTAYINIKVESKPDDTYKIQSNGGFPGYLSNTYTSNFDFTLFKKDNSYPLFNKISNKCGNGIFKDTLVITENPVLKYCFNFNKTSTDILGGSVISRNITTYVENRENQSEKAVKFISNSSVGITTYPDINQSNYSIAFWFKPGENYILDQNYQLYEFFYGAYDKLFIKKSIDSKYILTFQKFNSNNNFIITLPDISNQWSHIVFSYQTGNNTSQGEVKIFINGIEVKKQTINSIDPTSNSSYFYIGYPNNHSSFQGYFDDFKIYKGGLTYNQAFKLYSQNTECFAGTCENEANLSLQIITPVFNYGESLKYEGRLSRFGPVEYSMQINDFSPTKELPQNKNFEEINQNYGLFKSGENTLKINGIKNSCLVRSDTLLYSFYIKPKVVNCLPFNSANWNTNTNTETFETENLTLTSDRKGSPAKALAFQSNSKLLVSSNAFKGLNHSISLWINVKANSPDSFQVYFAGNATNNFQVKLKKLNGKYSIVGIRNGSFLKYENYKRVVSAAEINTETWSHIAVSFENSGMAIYLNGNLLTQRLDPVSSYTFVGILNLDKLNYRIGSDINNTQKMLADIDDFKFFDGGLNVHEAKYLSNSIDCDFNYCPKNTIITNGIAANGVYFGGESIKATNTVNQRTAYFSDQTIVLEPGFNTQNEAIFRAEIKNCGTLND